jgi:hypothetical protein
MKRNTFKNAVLAATLLATAGFSGLSFSNPVVTLLPNPGSLAAGGDKIDVYDVNCPAPTTGLTGVITNTAGTATSEVELSIGKIGVAGAGVAVSDTTAAGSATVSYNQGSGIYKVVLSHNSGSVNSYTATVNCIGGVTPNAAPGLFKAIDQ